VCVCLSVNLSVGMYVCMCFCVSVCLCFCLPACLSVFLSVRLSKNQNASKKIKLSNIIQDIIALIWRSWRLHHLEHGQRNHSTSKCRQVNFLGLFTWNSQNQSNFGCPTDFARPSVLFLEASDRQTSHCTKSDGEIGKFLNSYLKIGQRTWQNRVDSLAKLVGCDKNWKRHCSCKRGFWVNSCRHSSLLQFYSQYDNPQWNDIGTQY